VEALLAFAAALVALRLAGDLAARFRARRAPQLAAWSASLLAYAIASAALAWGAAAGWDDRAFRVYYLAGGLLTAPLLGAGSLLLRGYRWAAPLAFAYAGLAIGIMVAVPLTGSFSGTSIPEAQDHLDFVPARLVAVLGNSLGTLAVVAVALATLRRRPVGNTLLLAGVGVAAMGSGLAGLGIAETAVFIASAAVLLYAGFLVPGRTMSQTARDQTV
jgi:dipeptide/tripeptide permease